MKQKIKNFIDALIMIPILFGSTLICIESITTLSIPISIISLPIIIFSADRLKNDLEGNIISKSIFSVSRNGKIIQDTLKNPFRMYQVLKEKDKQKVLIYEELKMFEQLKRYNDKGKLMTYSTISQALTIKFLKKLMNDGYIENLSYQKTKKSNLFFEKLLIGNKSKTKNKYQMYKISFNLTNKKFNSNVLDNYINPKQSINNIDIQENIQKNNTLKENFNLSKQSTQSIQEKIQKLKELKENIINEDNDELLNKHIK